MKLKLYSVNFDEDRICFSVPSSIMDRAEWRDGVAEVDLSSIAIIDEEDPDEEVKR